MTQKTLKIKDYCGDDCVSRDDGLRLRKWIQKEWDKNDKLIFDFGNLLIASVSFLDEAFAQLAFEHEEKELVSKLKFENLRPFDRALLNDLVLARIRESKSTIKERKEKKARQVALQQEALQQAMRELIRLDKKNDKTNIKTSKKLVKK